MRRAEGQPLAVGRELEVKDARVVLLGGLSGLTVPDEARLARVDVKDPQLAVIRAGGDRVAIRRPGERLDDRVGCLEGQLARVGAGGDVEQEHKALRRAERDRPAVGRKGGDEGEVRVLVGLDLDDVPRAYSLAVSSIPAHATETTLPAESNAGSTTSAPSSSMLTFWRLADLELGRASTTLADSRSQLGSTSSCEPSGLNDGVWSRGSLPWRRRPS